MTRYIAIVIGCLLLWACAASRQLAPENAGNLGRVAITVSHRSDRIDLNCAGFGCVVAGVGEGLATGSAAGTAYAGGQQQGTHNALAADFRSYDPNVPNVLGTELASALRERGVSVTSITVTPFLHLPQPRDLLNQVDAAGFDTLFHIAVWGNGLTRSVTEPYSPTVWARGYLVRKSDGTLLYSQSYHYGTPMGGASTEIKASASHPRFQSVADASSALPQVAAGLEAAAKAVAQRFAADVAK